jgi:hypothetical protein
MALVRDKVPTFSLFNLIFNAKSCVSVGPSGVWGFWSLELRDSRMFGEDRV